MCSDCVNRAWVIGYHYLEFFTLSRVCEAKEWDSWRIDSWYKSSLIRVLSRCSFRVMQEVNILKRCIWLSIYGHMCRKQLIGNGSSLIPPGWLYIEWSVGTDYFHFWLVWRGGEHQKVFSLIYGFAPELLFIFLFCFAHQTRELE